MRTCWRRICHRRTCRGRTCRGRTCRRLTCRRLTCHMRAYWRRTCRRLTWIGGQLVGGQLVGGQLVGGRLVGSELVRGRLVGSELVRGAHYRQAISTSQINHPPRIRNLGELESGVLDQSPNRCLAIVGWHPVPFGNWGGGRPIVRFPNATLRANFPGSGSCSKWFGHDFLLYLWKIKKSA